MQQNLTDQELVRREKLEFLKEKALRRLDIAMTAHIKAVISETHMNSALKKSWKKCR